MHSTSMNQFNTAASHPVSNHPVNLWSWRYWRDMQPAWFYSAVGYALWMLLCIAGMLVDDRLLHGVSVWTKPFKFALSISVYFATLVAFAQYAPAAYLHSWRGRMLVGIPVLMAFGEMLYITWQASQGEASHFNDSSTFHQIMYSLMGFGATCMVAVLVWLAWVIGRNQSMNDPLMLGIVVGLVATFIFGGGFGGYMGSQTSHWVAAAATDADGLAFFNWTRNGGDLRVAHFFGMHAMQVIPLFALMLGRLSDRFSADGAARNTACTLVLAFTCAYCAFTTITFIQAVQGAPFIS